MNEEFKKPLSLETPVFSDDRGVFVPFIDSAKNSDLFSAMGGVKRLYYLHNHAPNIIRGFHYHDKEWKVFNVVSGAAKIVAVNPNDPKDIHTFVSSERKNQLVVVPPGYANGWMSLGANTVLVCVSNLTTEESLADDKRFDPYLWGDLWSVKGR